MKPVAPLALGLLLAACDGAGNWSTSDPVSIGEGSTLLAKLYTDGPIERGVNVGHLQLSGADTTGLALTVTPWMPAMGHGSSVVPTVSLQPDGSYEVDDLYVAMPGSWQLRLDVSGSTQDTLVLLFDVP